MIIINEDFSKCSLLLLIKNRQKVLVYFLKIIANLVMDIKKNKSLNGNY